MNVFAAPVTKRLLASSSCKHGFTKRYLSTHGQEAVGRLKDALEQYRVQNYQQEIPSRFRKELIGQCHHSGGAVQGIEQLLQNIGIFGSQITHDDVETIVSEFQHKDARLSSADKILSEVL